MAYNQKSKANLVPLTNEIRALGKKKSGETRSMRSAIDKLLNAPAGEKDIAAIERAVGKKFSKRLTNYDVLAFALISKGRTGDVAAIKTIIDATTDKQMHVQGDGRGGLVINVMSDGDKEALMTIE